MSSKRKFEQGQDVQNIVFQNLLSTKGPCVTGLSNIEEIENILNNIDIGLISADALCKHTFQVQAISEKKVEKPWFYKGTRKLLNIFDVSVSSLMSFIGGSSILYGASQLPHPILPGTEYLQAGLMISAAGIAANKIAFPIIDNFNLIKDKLVKGPEELFDQDALKCVKVYNKLDGIISSDCNKNSVLSCRDLYIKYHYLDKGINMSQLYEYLSIPSLVKKIFVQYMNYNEKNSKKRDVKYKHIKDVWIDVLIKSHNSNHDFSLVIFLLLQSLHPDEVYYSDWEDSILELVKNVLNVLKEKNKVNYNNCIVSLAMMDMSLNYTSEDTLDNGKSSVENTTLFLQKLDEELNDDIKNEKDTRIKYIYNVQSKLSSNKRQKN